MATRKSYKSKKQNRKINKKKTKKQKGGYNNSNYDIQLDGHLKLKLVNELKPVYDTLNSSSFYRDIYLPVYNEKIRSKKELFTSGTKKTPIITNNTNKLNRNMERVKIIKSVIDPFHKKTNKVDHYYIWWYSNLEKYGPETKKWKIMKDLKFCFINILTSIINSYLKYGFTDDEKLASGELKAFLDVLNDIDYENSEFRYFIKIFKTYTDWYNTRLESDSDCVNNLEDLIENSRYIIALPMAVILAPERYIRLFSAPILPFITKHILTHGAFSHPCTNFYHDMTHAKLFKIKETLKEKSDIIAYYENVNKFITKFSEEIGKLNTNKQRLFYGALFDLIHEHDGVMISSNYRMFIANNYNKNKYEHSTPITINKNLKSTKYQNKYDIMYNRGILRGLEYLVKEYDKDSNRPESEKKMKYKMQLSHNQGILEGKDAEEFKEFILIIKICLEGIDMSLPPPIQVPK